MKDLSRVQYKDGRAFIAYWHKTGKLKGYIKREYGQIIICEVCKEKTFSSNRHLKIGKGRFCSLKCRSALEHNPKWKNGRKEHEGYVLIKTPLHPNRNTQGYVFEHRLIVERMIGRCLYSWESVHHINKIRSDNRFNNLICFKNPSVHRKFELGEIVCSEDIVYDGSNVKEEVNHAYT